MFRILVIFIAWALFISAIMTMGIEFNGLTTGTLPFSAFRGIFLTLYYAICFTCWSIVMVKCIRWYK